MVTITIPITSYKKYNIFPKGVYINLNEKRFDNFITVDRFFIRLLNDDSDKSRIISTIIKIKYNQDEMDAIRNNYDLVRDGTAGDKLAEYTKQYNDMQDWRLYAKQLATEIIDDINNRQT